MRFYLAKRVHVPVVGSMIVGASFGGFHPSRVLHSTGSAPTTFADGFRTGFKLGLILFVVLLVWWLASAGH